MTFTPRTLNGRFALVTTVFLTVLLCLSSYSFFIVKKSSTENYGQIQINNQLSELIHHVIAELQHVETTLHQYASHLTQVKQEELVSHMEDTLVLTNRLLSNPNVQADPALQEQTTILSQQIQKLEAVINEYLTIMQKVESRFPGMPILMEHMEPSNRKFSEAVEQALQEGELTNFRPTVIESDHYRIMQLFQEARYAWSMQVSWFRVFVANRMGAFGDPEKAMKKNLDNRKMFIDNVSSILDKLDTYNEKGMLGIQQEESVHVMRKELINYNYHIDRAVTIYSSGDWRSDYALIRKSLQPVLDLVMESAEAIETIIYDSNKNSLANAQDTTVLLSVFILLFTAIVLSMLVIAYFVFQKHIRRPILQLANLMQSESLDSSGDKHNKSGEFEEIEQLIESYDDMRNQVHNRQLRLESILANAAEGIFTFSKDGAIETFNTAAQSLFNYSEDDIRGKNISILLSRHSLNAEAKVSSKRIVDKLFAQRGREQELRGLRSNGTEFIMSLKISEMVIDGRPIFTAIADDVTERHAAMDHLRHMAEHDALTGLYNRQYFNTTLEKEFERARRGGSVTCACLYIDLDNFKYVNDTLGHQEGDRLLIGISHTLAARTRKSDTLARLGGDEFALILTNVDHDNIQTVANEYREAISNYTFIADGKHIETGCSIGVALFEPDIESKENLLARADIACHMAKRAGRNRAHLFVNKDKDRIDSFHEEMGWSRRIRHALEHDGFVFTCQPILDVTNREIFSHELLLRMKDVETGEYILPGGFLAAAERFGLMPEIDRWVVKHAFKWLNNEPENNTLKYFINLSGKSIGDTLLLECIKTSLANLTISPAQVVFEITENVAISDLDNAKHFISELKEMGFKTALDDFGVGYSSFTYLRELDVDYVKIDGSFIDSMHNDELNFALVKAINDVCHILGKSTIAEFVQNEESMILLQEIGVDFAQGYNIATADEYDQQTIQFQVG